MTADLPTIRVEQMFWQQCPLEERVRIENYASKSNDFRTYKISKVLFLTESEITVVAKELKKTSNQSRFTYSQSVLITNDTLKCRQNNFLCTNTVESRASILSNTLATPPGTINQKLLSPIFRMKTVNETNIKKSSL